MGSLKEAPLVGSPAYSLQDGIAGLGNIQQDIEDNGAHQQQP